jgi:hypothetical protein
MTSLLLFPLLLLLLFLFLRASTDIEPRAVPERSLDAVVLVMVWATLGAPARSWRSLGEEERSSSFLPFPLESSGVAGAACFFTGSGSRALVVVLVRGCTALEASASFGWSLDEVERTSSFFTVFPADSLGVAAAAR